MTNLDPKNLKKIMNIALEFRLSLKNICRFLKINQSDENQKLIYDEIIINLNDPTLKNKFMFLVYDTSGESEHDSNVAYNVAKICYLKYLKEAISNKDKKPMINKLFKTDLDYDKLKIRGIKRPISEQDALIIAKYRLKNAITKEQMAAELEVNRRSIDKWENKISQYNHRLGNRLSKLNEYNYDISKKHFIAKLRRKK